MRNHFQRLAELRKNPLLLGVGVQLLIVLIALFIGVLRPVAKEDRSFKASGSSDLTESKAEKAKGRMKAYQSLKPSQEAWEDQMDQSLDLALEMPPLDAGAINFPVESLMNTQSLFQGDISSLEQIDVSSDFSDMESTVDFMGLKANAERVLFAIDVSASVKTKVDRAGVGMSSLRSEVQRSLGSLGVGQLFNVVQFSRKWSFFSDSFLPGTKKVKENASDWLQTKFRTNGTSGSGWKQSERGDGFLELLQTVFIQFPEIDLLVLVSDGDFQTSKSGGGYRDIDWDSIIEATKSFQSKRPTNLKLSVVGFCLEQDIKLGLERWLNEFDGDLLEFVEK